MYIAVLISDHDDNLKTTRRQFDGYQMTIISSDLLDDLNDVFVIEDVIGADSLRRVPH